MAAKNGGRKWRPKMAAGNAGRKCRPKIAKIQGEIQHSALITNGDKCRPKCRPKIAKFSAKFGIIIQLQIMQKLINSQLQLLQRVN